MTVMHFFLLIFIDKTLKGGGEVLVCAIRKGINIYKFIV